MKREDLPVLTALRFPAAFAIVLLHYLPEAGVPLWKCEGLGAGVSFFYVLSGFILYYNYHDLKNRNQFWLARFARIWPLHFVTCVMALALIPFVSLDGHAHWPISLPANLLLLHAWIPLEGSALSYNGVSWSLSVEAFFYLIFPLLLALLPTVGISSLLVVSGLIGIVLTSLATIWLPGQPNFGIYDPPCRLFEFVLGIGACYFWLRSPWRETPHATGSRDEILSVLALSLLILVLRPLFKEFCLTSPISDWLVSAVCAIGFAVLVWIFAHQAGVVSRFFSAKLFILLGQVSFSTYMCHQILLRWLDMNFRIPLEIKAPLYLGLTVAVSFLLYHLVENPARHLIMNRSKRRPVTPGASPS